MFIDNSDFILTAEKAEKITWKIEVFRIKQAALATIADLLKPHDGKVLNARVFKAVEKEFNSKNLVVCFNWRDYTGCLEIRLFGNAVTYEEGRWVFTSDSIKKGDRLNYAVLRAEMIKKIDSYAARAAECEKALKTLKSTLKKALAAFETLKTVAYSIPFEIREEFKIFKELY